MLRVLLIILLSLSLSLSLSLPLAAPSASASQEPSPEPTRDNPVLLVLGDSLSAAYGLPLDQGWVSLLQRRIADLGLPHEVVNAAISGDTVAGGLSRLPRLLREHEPSILLIELGANDGLRGFPPAKIESNLVSLVEQAQAAGARVVVAGIRLPPNYGPAYTERFQRLFANVANETGAALIPRLLAGVAEVPNLMQSDGLHPTAEAQPLILDNVWPVLLPLLRETDSVHARVIRKAGMDARRDALDVVRYPLAEKAGPARGLADQRVSVPLPPLRPVLRPVQQFSAVTALLLSQSDRFRDGSLHRRAHPSSPEL